MFRSRLAIAFATLAAVAVIQGATNWWALKVADHNVQKGRVANELLVGFVDLLANKQRLRSWLSSSLLGGDPEPSERQLFYQTMLLNLDELDLLARRAAELSRDEPELIPEHQQRIQALAALRIGVEQLREPLFDADLSRPNGNPSLAWRQMNRIFDVADGTDLKAMLSQSIARERFATARDRAAADASLRLLNRGVVVTTILLTLLAVVLAVYFSRALNKPLRKLTLGAKALEEGNLDHRIPDNTRDEFADLARSMNLMAREISRLRLNDTQAREQLEVLVQQRTAEVQDALHSLEKLELRRRQMFADISHELKTPTTAIRGEAEITLRGADKPLAEYKEALTRIVEYSQQLALVVDDMLTMARSDIDTLLLDRKPVAMQEVFNELVEQMGPAVRSKSIKLKLDWQVNGFVLGDRQRLRQLLVIIVDNAVQYSMPKGTVEIGSYSLIDAEGTQRCQIIIRDEGIGMNKHDLGRVFERHYRSERAKEFRPDGNGLGLPLAAALVRAHHGSIDIQSEEGVGTVVTVSLPMFDSQLQLEQS